MIRQYRPQRHRIEETPRGPMAVGTVKVGEILKPRNGCKIQVLAWLPRDYSTYSNGRFATKRITGGHLALVRRLHDGKEFELSDVWLVQHD